MRKAGYYNGVMFILSFLLGDLYASQTALTQRAPVNKKKPSLQTIKMPSVPSEGSIISAIQSDVKKLNTSPHPSKDPLLLGGATGKEKVKKEEGQEEKISTILKTEEQPGELKGIFKFEKGVPYYAVFSVGTTWYVALSFPSTFEYKSFNRAPNSKLISVKSFSQPSGLLIKFQFRKKLYPLINFENETNTLVLKFTKNALKEEPKGAFSHSRKKGDPLIVKVPLGRSEDFFFDDETKNGFLVITAYHPQKKPVYFHKRTYPGFEIAESYHGLALILLNSDINPIFKGGKLIIPDLPNIGLYARENNKPLSIDSAFFKEYDPKKALSKIRELGELSLGKKNPLYEHIESVWWWVAESRGAESLNILNRLREKNPEMDLVPFLKALEGLSHLMVGRGKKGALILDSLKDDPEPRMWGTIGWLINQQLPFKKEEIQQAKTQLPVISDPLEGSGWQNYMVLHKDKLLLLPPKIYNTFLAKILEVGISENYIKLLETFARFKPKIDHIRSDLRVIPYAELAQALIYLELYGDPKKIGKYLNFPFNQKIKTLANFYYVKYQQKNRKISTAEEFKNLEALRFQWRGDMLEYNITLHLVKRYEEEKKYHRALPILRKLIKYYPYNALEDGLSSRMQRYLKDYFHLKPFPPLMQALSIFQEFGDILPSDPESDEVMLLATNGLVKLSLYDEAMGIIKTYITDKVSKDKPTTKRLNNLYYRLALIGVSGGRKREEIFGYLEKIIKPEEEMDTNIRILKSILYEKGKDKEKAISILGSTDVENQRKGDLYFADNKWEEALASYTEILKNIDIEKTKTLSQTQQKAAFHRALCLALGEKNEELKELGEQYGKYMEKGPYEVPFAFLTKKHLLKSQDQLQNLKNFDNYLKALNKIFDVE